MNEYMTVLKKYAQFDGRASRKEYWMYFLFTVIISIVLSVIDGAVGLTIGPGLGILSTLYALAVLVPGIAVAVRRLHDINKSGMLVLLGLIPCVGLILLVWFIQDSDPGSNQYGPNPKSLAGRAERALDD